MQGKFCQTANFRSTFLVEFCRRRKSVFFVISIDNQLYYAYNTVIKRIIRVVQLKEQVSVMVSFDRFQAADGLPIYQQIILYIKRNMVAGVIRDGDELPSRRVLSALLAINPNTVQKTYRLLEEEGLIQSHSGSKSYVVLDSEKLSSIRGELVEADARSAVLTLRQMGISKEEAFALLSKYWDGGDTP